MRKEDFLKKMEELKPKLKNIVVEVDESLPADYAIGCYFEKQDHTWRVYSKILPDKVLPKIQQPLSFPKRNRQILLRMQLYRYNQRYS